MANIGENIDTDPIRVVISKRLRAVKEVMKLPIVKKYYFMLMLLGF